MLQGRPSTVYSLTKGAIQSFIKALVVELREKGIRVILAIKDKEICS